MARFTHLLCYALLTTGAEFAYEPASHAAEATERPPPGSCGPAAQPAEQAEAEVDVWIDLSVPALSTLPGHDREARAALRARIEKQQAETMAQLVALGATESARVTEVRNAIAVRVRSSAIAEIRTLPGVVKVRAVKHRQRMPACNSGALTLQQSDEQHVATLRGARGTPATHTAHRIFE